MDIIDPTLLKKIIIMNTPKFEATDQTPPMQEEVETEVP